jgi:hypothetical protein
MSGLFDHWLAVAPEVIDREVRMALYLERAHQLQELAEECRRSREAALDAAFAYERMAGQLLATG